MPNTKSTIKRIRQDEKKKLRNRIHKSVLRKSVKAFRSIEDTEAARTELPGMISTIDKSVKKGIIHHRTAARMKSRLSRKAQ